MKIDDTLRPSRAYTRNSPGYVPGYPGRARDNLNILAHRMGSKRDGRAMIKPISGGRRITPYTSA